MKTLALAKGHRSPLSLFCREAWLAPMMLACTTLHASAASMPQEPQVEFLLQGEAAEDNFGTDVRFAGDFNGDGVGDLVIGARKVFAGGEALVYSGVDGALLYRYIGEPGSFTGFRVSAAGDVNADGFDDLLVASSIEDGSVADSGVVRVLSGPSGDELYRFDGTNDDQRLGSDIDGLGDINGDGFDDFVIGAWGDATNGLNAGRAQVHSGQDGSVLYSFYGAGPVINFGYATRCAGDVDGDGVADLIVGASHDDTVSTNSGSAYVYSGATGSLLHSFFGEGPSDYFGLSVDGAGDVDADGHADLIIGAPEWMGSQGGKGRAYVYSGLSGALLYTYEGASNFDWFGWSVRGLGDFDGDGRDDFAIGVPQAGSGEIRVHSGLDGSEIFRFFGPSAAWLGIAIDAIPDRNGDGRAELIVGASRQEEASGERAGAAWVLFGQPAGATLGIPYCTSSPNSTGLAAEITASGLLSVAGGHLVLRTEPVPDQVGLFYYGPTQTQVPFGNGLRCVSGTVTRLALSSPSANSLSYPLIAETAPTPIQAGSTWNFQAWFRDPGVGAGFNLSNGLSLTFQP